MYITLFLFVFILGTLSSYPTDKTMPTKIFRHSYTGFKLPLTRKIFGGIPVNRWRLTKDGIPSKVPLGGSVEEFGEYFVSLTIGTPAQDYFFQVDTGSTDLLVYGKACSGCPENATRYDPAKSSSGIPVACHTNKYSCEKCYQPGDYCSFDDAYGDGSDVNGYVLTDIISIGGAVADISLGLIQNSSANFEPTGVDGIFGLAYPSTSSWDSASPLIEWLQQNNMYKSFGMCLLPDGGSLSLGINEHNNPNVMWTKTAMNHGQLIYYPVNMTDLKVNGISLNLSSTVLNGAYSSLIDSGTTLVIVPSPVFNKLHTTFLTLCSKYKLPGICDVPDGKSLFDGNCVPMTDQDRAAFPSISFGIDQIKADLGISNVQYLVSQNSTEYDVEWCLGIQSSSDSEPVTILGDTFMRAFYVVFDQETQTVGFGPQSTCT